MPKVPTRIAGRRAEKGQTRCTGSFRRLLERPSKAYGTIPRSASHRFTRAAVPVVNCRDHAAEWARVPNITADGYLNPWRRASCDPHHCRRRLEYTILTRLHLD